MLRAASALAFCLALLAPAFARQQPPAGATPAPIDQTPSDPAATGFLTSVVDARVYSHESIGAARLTAKVKAQFVVTSALDQQQPTTQLDFNLDFDYATGAFSLKPVQPGAAAHRDLLMAINNAARNALLLKPSRSADGWKVSLHQDGEQWRLDYLPRSPATGAIESFAEWFKQDGTPLRRRIVSRVPNGAQDFNTVTQEVAFDYEEVGKRLLLKELKPIEQLTGRFGMRMEYAERDGVHLLTRFVQEEAGWRLTLEFDSKLERAAKR